MLITANLGHYGHDELLVSFRELQGLYLYDFVSGAWTRILTISLSRAIPADVTGNSKMEIIFAFEGLWTYIAEYDVKNRFVTGKDLKKTFQWSRITCATPNQGHNIGCANISENSGKNIFITHQGRTYFYSYQGSSWHTFSHAPFDNILSGRFTNENYYNIIASESIGGVLNNKKPFSITSFIKNISSASSELKLHCAWVR